MLLIRTKQNRMLSKARRENKQSVRSNMNIKGPKVGIMTKSGRGRILLMCVALGQSVVA